MAKDKTYNKLIQSKQWRALRNEAIAQHPYCSLCNRITTRLAVHHIVPCETARTERDMEALMFATTNLQVLCYECHNNLHKQMRSHSKEVHAEREEQKTKRFLDKFL